MLHLKRVDQALVVALQCYVQQLRQLRQDAKQVEPARRAPSLSQARHSGEVDCSLLSPRAQPHQLTPSLALHLTTARSGSGQPSLAISKVPAIYLSCLVAA